MAMTKEKIISSFYNSAKRVIETKNYNPVSQQEASEKLKDMFERFDEFVAKENKRDKIMRWLGFAQGVGWALGFSTLENLKRDSMPDNAEYKDKNA